MTETHQVPEDCGMKLTWGKQFEINKTLFTHMKAGDGWRKAIIAIVFAIVIQVVTFATMWGELKTMVNYNSRDIARVCVFLDNNLPSKLDKILNKLDAYVLPDR